MNNFSFSIASKADFVQIVSLAGSAAGASNAAFMFLTRTTSIPTKFMAAFCKLQDFEVIIKNLNLDVIKRLLLEYPDLLKLEINNKKKGEQGSKTIEEFPLLTCLTLVKNNLDINNQIK